MKTSFLRSAVMAPLVVLVSACATRTTAPPTAGSNVSALASDQVVVLRPEGGLIELEAGAVLDVPAGAVESPTEVRWRLLHAAEINRTLYTQYSISKHWAGREINGVPFNGNPPQILVAGIELEPTGLELRRPLAVTLPLGVLFNGGPRQALAEGIELEPTALEPLRPLAATRPLQPFYRPRRPAHVLINQQGELAEYVPAPIDVRPTGSIDLPDPWEPVDMYSATFGIRSLSRHAVIDVGSPLSEEPFQGDDPSECEVPETKCRCGRIFVERGEHDYSNSQCTLSQSVVRVTFLDCPGQPVEEHSEAIPAAGCENVEPIPELLNYRPGKRWSLTWSSAQFPPYGGWQQRLDTRIDATFEILPAVSPDGEQSIRGDASAVVNWEAGPAHYCPWTRMGPVSVPVTFDGSMRWFSPSDPPSAWVKLVLKLAEAPTHAHSVILACGSPPNHEREVNILYPWFYYFAIVPSVPFKGTMEYPHGSRVPETPFWYIVMPSWLNFTSKENLSLSPVQP